MVRKGKTSGLSVTGIRGEATVDVGRAKTQEANSCRHERWKNKFNLNLLNLGSSQIDIVKLSLAS